MSFSKPLTTRCSTLFMVIVAVSILSVGCGGDVSSTEAIANGSVTLDWTAPTTYVDGSPITDLEGYRVYYGETSQAYTDIVVVGNITSCSIGGLPTGKPLYFSVTAFDLSGNESTFSSEVSAVISSS